VRQVSEESSEILQRLARLEVKLDMMYNDPSRDRRLNDLEDNQKWLWRAVVGVFVAGAISYLMKAI